MSLDRLAAILTEALAITEALRIVALPVVPPDPPSPNSYPIRLYTGVTHEYSTMFPGNSDHRALLLQHDGGAIGLHYADGQFFKLLPSFIHHSSQPRWSRKKPRVFRYLYLNEVREFDVATDQTVILRKFKEYANVNSLGEADSSLDDDHIVLMGGSEVFVYEISSDTKGPVLETAGHPIDSLYLTPSNQVVITWM